MHSLAMRRFKTIFTDTDVVKQLCHTSQHEISKLPMFSDEYILIIKKKGTHWHSTLMLTNLS